MKYTLTPLLVLLWGCRENAGGRPDIDGSYVCSAESTCSKAWDTLTINRQNDRVYIIEQKVDFERIVRGSAEPREHKGNRFQAAWDPAGSQLYEQKLGRIYTIDPVAGTITTGAKTYLKIQ